MKCRRCQSLSCIDCGKEFWGDSYQNHTKCISEEEKYSGKNFVSKPNKGEVKQEQWIQKVQAAIQKASSNSQLRTLLQKLEDFPNIPRKKAKFENFLKCSLRVMNKGLVDQVWDLLMAEAQQPAQNGNTNNSTNNSQSSQASTVESGNSAKPVKEEAEEEEEEPEKKLSKRERKELRQKKAHKGEKKDKQAAEGTAEEESCGKNKKGGKRKRRDEEEEEEAEDDNSGKKKKGKRKRRDKEEDEEQEEEVVSKPKKKKRKGENGTAVETQEDGEGKLNNTLQDVEQRGKFDWGQTITAVLQTKGEIAVKKLQKKVLAEYLSYGSNKPEDRLEAKFLKKLNKMPNVRVLKDRACLTQS